MNFNKRIPKNWVIIALIFSILFLVPFSISANNSLFEYNLIDVLTFSILTLLYFYIDNVKAVKKDRTLIIEKTVEDIQKKCVEVGELLPVSSNYTKFLYLFKYISNKIAVLESLLDKNRIKELNDSFDCLRNFLDQINSQFNTGESSEELKRKIANETVRMESSLGKIIIYIYTE